MTETKRVIFAIHDGRAVLAKDGTTLTHVAYMVQQGILKSATDTAYEQVVRGYVERGQLYVMQGSRLFIGKPTTEVRDRLRQISQQLGLDKSKPVMMASYPGSHLGQLVTTPKLIWVPWQIWPDEAKATSSADAKAR